MNFVSLIGHLHPLLVHLPIGILVLAIFFEWLSHKSSWAFLSPAVKLSALIGFITAVASCITGLVLAQDNSYDESTLATHQWLALSTALCSGLFWWSKQRSLLLFSKASSLLTLCLLLAAGHFGGSLTHGENYLLAQSSSSASADLSSVDLSTALFYHDLVQPILSEKCYSCHGSTKQKGKLRLDDSTQILNGGKHGKALVPGHPDESEMISRLLLPMEDEDHMPPKEKAQLSKAEIDILNKWIALGASFHKPVSAFENLAGLRDIIKEKEEVTAPVAEANSAAIKRLRQWGVVVVEVSMTDHHVSANFQNVTQLDSALRVLLDIKPQLVGLTITGRNLSVEQLAWLGKLESLRRLDISHDTLAVGGLAPLNSLKELQYLNLAFSTVDAQDIAALNDLKNLSRVFAYQTKLTEDDLKRLFPNAAIDMGGYAVPTFATDTQEVKAPK